MGELLWVSGSVLGMLCLDLFVPGSWSLSFLSWVNREPELTSSLHLPECSSSFLSQAGNPVKCRHGHCPTAATEANDTGPSCLQCCDHPWAWPHIHIPFVACRSHPHSHPGLAFSGTLWSPLPAPSLTLSALAPPQQSLCYLPTPFYLFPAFLLPLCSEAMLEWTGALGTCQQSSLRARCKQGLGLGSGCRCWCASG